MRVAAGSPPRILSGRSPEDRRNAIMSLPRGTSVRTACVEIRNEP